MLWLRILKKKKKKPVLRPVYVTILVRIQSLNSGVKIYTFVVYVSKRE